MPRVTFRLAGAISVESINLRGEKQDGLLQRGHSKYQTDQSKPDRVAIEPGTDLLGGGHRDILDGLKQALADMALSDSRITGEMPVALHSEDEPNRSDRGEQG